MEAGLRKIQNNNYVLRAIKNHIYVHIYMYMYMNIHTHTHTHTYIYTHIYMALAKPIAFKPHVELLEYKIVHGIM